MQNLLSYLNGYEEIILTLRSLYDSYGYQRCSVSTFEEYDFYSKNRSALSGEEVLIFTDADGRLMALKPDVTMSIVKHIDDCSPGLKKVCYNENIYRIPTGGAGFRETVQTGLECIGPLDSYAIGEVIMLALKSLKRIQSGYILNLTHMDIVDGLLDIALCENADRTPILKAMEQKNLSALESECKKNNMQNEYMQDLLTLTELYGTVKETLPQIEGLCRNEKMKKAFKELSKIQSMMDSYGMGHHLYLDFSIRGGDDYYSAIVFRGFLEGISSPILSGGRYDKLIHRMGKKSGGIGFAVYLDQLKRKTKDEKDGTLLLYDDSVSAEDVIRNVSVLKQDGIKVRAQKEISPECRYTHLLKLTENGVTEIE